MKLVVTLEYRFAMTPDGAAWTATMFGRPFWDRYLEVFDVVTVVARARRVPLREPEWERVDGDRVMFVSLPPYVGPWQYLLHRGRVSRRLHEALRPDAAVLFRLGSPLADLGVRILRTRGQPYGAEVVGDPWDCFAPGALRHPLRPVFRRAMARSLRDQCAGACAVAYVTERALQRRYPPGAGAFTTNYSSIQLDDGAFVATPRSKRLPVGPRKLVAVGTLQQMYKGFDTLIQALSIAVHEHGLDLELEIIGDGRHRADLQQLADDLAVSARIIFRGQLPAGATVRAVLDRADLFVMPSRQEGLPRAMIEAMARALPCLGSDIGGIPELLDAEDLVPPGNPGRLARAIVSALGDQERLARASARNLAKAADYREAALAGRRRELYVHLFECTQAWIRSRGMLV